MCVNSLPGHLLSVLFFPLQSDRWMLGFLSSYRVRTVLEKPGYDTCPTTAILHDSALWDRLRWQKCNQSDFSLEMSAEELGSICVKC